MHRHASPSRPKEGNGPLTIGTRVHRGRKETRPKERGRRRGFPRPRMAAATAASAAPISAAPRSRAPSDSRSSPSRTSSTPTSSSRRPTRTTSPAARRAPRHRLVAPRYGANAQAAACDPSRPKRMGTVPLQSSTIGSIERPAKPHAVARYATRVHRRREKRGRRKKGDGRRKKGDGPLTIIDNRLAREHWATTRSLHSARFITRARPTRARLSRAPDQCCSSSTYQSS